MAEKLSVPHISILVGFGFLFICMLFASSFTGVIIGWCTGEEVKNISDLAKDPSTHWVFRLVQGFSGFAIWGLAAIFWATYTGGFPQRLGFMRKTWPGFYLLAILATACALPFVEWLLFSENSLNLPEALEGFEKWIIKQESKTEGALLEVFKDFSIGAILGNFFVIAIIPAFAEEMFFRGFLLSTLRRMINPHAAVWISALIFSLLHFQFYGLFSRMALGAMLGYFYLWSGNLWASILAHFIHNFISLLIALLALKGILSQAILEDDFGFGSVATILSFCLTFLLLYLYWRNSKKRNTKLAHE